MQTIRVMVTGCGCGGVGEQILKALQFSKLPLHVIAADCAAKSTGFKLADSACILPRADDKEYIAQLIEQSLNQRVDALFVGSEKELVRIAPHRDLFAKANIFLPLQPDNVLATCLDKNKLFDFLEDQSFIIPWHCHVHSLSDIETRLPFPSVFKPATQTGGSNDVYIVQNHAEALLFGTYLLSLYNSFLAQEYVGTPENEYTVGVLCDMMGNLLGSIAMRRTLAPALSRRLRVPNRTERENLGPWLAISNGVSQGEFDIFPEVREQCEQIACILGCRGPMNIQCRFVDGHIQIFEINPRFSGTTSLRALAGWNEPEILLRNHFFRESPNTQNIQKISIARRLEEIIL